MQNDWLINVNTLKVELETFEIAYKTIEEKHDDLVMMGEKISNSIPIGNAMNVVISESAELAKKLKMAHSCFEMVLNQYTNTEKKILSKDIGDKQDGKKTSGSDSKSQEEMTYEEYLQYRYENAVDENTKKLYEKYLNEIKIKDDDYSNTAFYFSFWNHIKYNKDDDYTNDKGPGSTYYHEVGHCMDDKSDWFGYTSSDGSYDFYNCLNEDLDNYINKIMEENGYTDRHDAYDDLSAWLLNDPDNKDGVSDLVTGLTDGKARGKWAHDVNYYNSSSTSFEAFAHFFEAGMSADSTKLDYMKEIFPTAYEEYQKMLEDELK